MLQLTRDRTHEIVADPRFRDLASAGQTPLEPFDRDIDHVLRVHRADLDRQKARLTWRSREARSRLDFFRRCP
jgi:hypothetical protein